MTPLEQHQTEIQQNLKVWQEKPLLQKVYAGFYQRILFQINLATPGLIVETGSGIGNLKEYLPQAICSDLFPNPWLDLVCDGYEFPFADESVSHLVLFDVFHHLRAPRAFLKEARRVLTKNGRLILFEPYISASSFACYEYFHHEGVHWRDPIFMGENLPRPRDYYTGQGNSTRLFFGKEYEGWLNGWNVFHAEAFSGFHYFFSGGYSKPSLYPESWLLKLQKIDLQLSKWPRFFGARCLIGLTPNS